MGIMDNGSNPIIGMLIDYGDMVVLAVLMMRMWRFAVARVTVRT